MRHLKILEKHLKRLRKHLPDYEIEVQYLKGKVAKKRVKYPSGDENYFEVANQRTVLPDEVVVDLDGDTNLENGDLLKESQYRLNIRGYSYEVWESGGKGYHIHMIFPELLKLNEFQRKYVRAKFLSLFKDLKGDQLKKSERTTIQMEWTSHRKTSNYKTLVEEHKGHRHNVPKKWLSEASRTTETRFRSERIRSKGSLHPLAKEMLNAVLTDARKRMAFYLAAHLRNAYGDKQKVFELLQKWNDRQTKKMSDMHLQSTVNSVFNSRETPGTQYLKDILYGVELV